ncbi:hypothetical protein N7465_006360 [Penicillium sp. CMV-2018d]|nr:hypothetical protein N7465_006360 [Penicillium sp. CMV-2018d]
MCPVSSGSDVRPVLHRHPFPEPLVIFRQYDLEQEDDYWEAIARVEAAEIALADTPSSRPLLKRLLAFVMSDPAAVETQLDAPTLGDPTIWNDAVEVDLTMPLVSRLYTPIPWARVEYTTASDYRGLYPLYVIHIPPGVYVLN